MSAPDIPRRPLSTGMAIKDHFVLLFGLLGAMWALEVLDLLPFLELDQYGIRPRSAAGLPGIVLTPFLHGGFGHLLMNSLPFVILGGGVLCSGLRTFWVVTVVVTLVGGLGVWLFAPEHTVHIGASGVVFGYLGFLVARGFFERSFRSILTSIVVLFVYGGLLFGVLPTQTGVSWQGHLFGLIAGIGTARAMFRKAAEKPRWH